MILLKSIPIPRVKTSTFYVECEGGMTVTRLKEKVYSFLAAPTEVFTLHRDGKRLDDGDVLDTNDVVHIHFPLVGGKGGFGSMLRAIGAQIEKTTNKEACRDLSGRRLRDINEEQRLKKWIAKQAERERERMERKKERLQRLQAKPNHKFHDPEYDKVFSNMASNIDDALSEGLKKAETGEVTVKRKNVSEPAATTTKKLKQCVGFDEDIHDLSSSDSSDTEDDTSTENSNLCPTNLTSESPQPGSSKMESADPKPSKSVNIVQPCYLDLEPYTSIEQLEQLGLDRLKAALMDRGMKCGGTLRQRAERLFSIKGKKEIDPILLAEQNKR